MTTEETIEPTTPGAKKHAPIWEKDGVPHLDALYEACVANGFQLLAIVAFPRSEGDGGADYVTCTNLEFDKSHYPGLWRVALAATRTGLIDNEAGQ